MKWEDLIVVKVKEAERQGQAAWEQGKGEDACPWKDEYEGGDFWESPMALRQAWLRGFRLAYMWRRK